MACMLLVIEDDLGVREAVVDALSDSGYVVKQACDGHEALDVLRAGAVKPCLLLLDLRMSGMNGWTFLREQQRDPLLSKIPVIVTSVAAPDLGTAAEWIGRVAR